MYEAVVADLIDHTIAVTAEFGLRLYQSPGSYDIQCLRGKSKSNIGKMRNSRRYVFIITCNVESYFYLQFIG